MMDVNYMGTFFGARAALPLFRAQNSGHLIFVSSIVGRRGIPFMGGYSATKAAQAGLAESLRAEFAGTGDPRLVRLPDLDATEFREAMARDYRSPHDAASGRSSRSKLVAARSSTASAGRGPRCIPHAHVPHAGRLNAVAPAFTDRLVRKYGRRRDAAATHRVIAVSEPALEIAARIARAVRAAGGRALDRRRLGARSADAASPRRTSTSRSSASTPTRCAALLGRFGPVNTVGESFTVYKVGRPRRLAAATRVEGRPRASRLRRRSGDPRLSLEEAARRRDFTINAIAWDPLTDEYIDPFDGRARPRAPAAPRRRSRDVRRRQPARAARDPVRGALRVRGRSSDEGAVPPHSARRSAGRADLGRDREAARCGRDGRRSASPSRSISASSSGCSRSSTRSSAARRSRSGIPKGTSGSTRCSSSIRRARGSTISTIRSRSR